MTESRIIEYAALTTAVIVLLVFAANILRAMV